jgi:hypothetical protein
VVVQCPVRQINRFLTIILDFDELIIQAVIASIVIPMGVISDGADEYVRVCTRNRFDTVNGDFAFIINIGALHQQIGFIPEG